MDLHIELLEDECGVVSGVVRSANPQQAAELMAVPIRVTEFEVLDRARVEYDDRDRRLVIEGLAARGWRTKRCGPASSDGQRQYAILERTSDAWHA